MIKLTKSDYSISAKATIDSSYTETVTTILGYCFASAAATVWVPGIVSGGTDATQKNVTNRENFKTNYLKAQEAACSCRHPKNGRIGKIATDLMNVISSTLVIVIIYTMIALFSIIV